MNRSRDNAAIFFLVFFKKHDKLISNGLLNNYFRGVVDKAEIVGIDA
jgi:hypothetical protein